MGLAHQAVVVAEKPRNRETETANRRIRKLKNRQLLPGPRNACCQVGLVMDPLSGLACGEQVKLPKPSKATRNRRRRVRRKASPTRRASVPRGPMTLHVRVQRSKGFDHDAVARLLGDQPLPVSVQPGEEGDPFLTVAGRIHRPTSDFLRSYARARAEPASARRYATDLKGWLEFLCNVQGYHPYEDHRDPVFMATEEDFAAYWRRRQFGREEDLLSSEGWSNARKAIKRFYEYAQRAYFHPPPFQVRAFRTPHGYGGTQITGYAPRRRRTGSAGKPLTPSWAEQLLMGALRITSDGTQQSYHGADRDHALVSLCLATGMRRNNLVYMTTYEVPPINDLSLTTTQVADLVTKGGAGGDALTFTYRLSAVHNYIKGPRAEHAVLNLHRPQHPLHVVDADRSGFRYLDPEATDPQQVRQGRWHEADGPTRLRLINPDGTSPILFLNTLTGTPLTYSAVQHIVPSAAQFVRTNINADFPPAFRLHDLRHTYAVHLAVVIYRNVLADALRHDSRPDDSWVIDHIAQAVELVKYSLGHASESSTRLYIQAVHRFLGIPLEHFLGEA